jgi:hypothetical protein
MYQYMQPSDRSDEYCIPQSEVAIDSFGVDCRLIKGGFTDSEKVPLWGNNNLFGSRRPSLLHRRPAFEFSNSPLKPVRRTAQ